MAEIVPESAYFPHDREQLLNTIARFDNGERVEDVVGPENDFDLMQYSSTVLIQALLEFICYAFVKDEIYREKLLMEACKRLSKSKMMNDLLIMDKNNELRLTMKRKIINFLKQICKEVIPTAELNTNAVKIFQDVSLSTELKLYYCTNFIQLGKIAQGGFGSVYKAEYKLNKLIYAIKKIPFDYKSDTNFLMVMREANNFAALSHINIVRYYSAWIEMSESDAVNNLTDDTSCVTAEYSGFVIKETPSKESYESMSESGLRKYSSEISKSDKSDSIIFSESAEITNNENWLIENYNQSSSDYSKGDTENESDYHNANEDFSLSNLKTKGVLYIQMEYCDCDLQYWLDKRAEGKELPFEMNVDEIFISIVKGVAHIHSRGIMHRDLKPHNIFYSKTCNTVKIGDFGLATLSENTGDFPNSASHDRSSGVGTIPYSAPEQRVSKKYDMMVDIYSLGVILIELINVCATRSELYQIIKAIKDGKITRNDNFPVLWKLASILISDDPKKRMSAKEILDFIDKDSKVICKEVIRSEFLAEIKAKDERIQNLNDKYNELDTRYHELNSKYKEMAETLQKMQELVFKQKSETSMLSDF